MTTKYLLPCECGESIPIEASQAGQLITCACGKTQEAPSMRSVRNLNPYEPAAELPVRKKASWNPAAGGVFMVGAILVVAGILAAGFAHFSRQALEGTLPRFSQERIDAWVADIDNTPPELLWDNWHGTIARGLGDYESSPFVMFRRQSRKYDVVVWLGAGLAVTGVIVVFCARFLRQPAA